MLFCKNDMLACWENEDPPEVSGSNNRRFHPISQELLLFASCLLLDKVMTLHDLLCAICKPIVIQNTIFLYTINIDPKAADTLQNQNITMKRILCYYARVGENN